jgi:uncharacterized protein
LDATLREEGSFSVKTPTDGPGGPALKRGPHAAGTAAGYCPARRLLKSHLVCIAAKRKIIATKLTLLFDARAASPSAMHVIPGNHPPSPCDGTCRVSEQTGWCLGCKRTLNEIADWPMLSPKEKRGVLAGLDRR